MEQYRYINEPLPKLELDKKRFRVKHCPCGKSNKDGKFVPYVGYEDKGYCHSCGETFLPELSKVEHWNAPQQKPFIKQKTVIPQPKTVSLIPVEVFKASLKSHEENHFVTYLKNLFGIEIKNQLISLYFIATSKHWNGATVFWQIDAKGKIRTGKIMLYSPTTGKRVKEPFNHITWVHKALKQTDFNLKQCLFGEHLLSLAKNKTKPIAIVESEKTAIIASIYFPRFIWLATSGADGLSADKCDTLNKHGQPVILFPDISKPKEGKETTFEKWVKIANKYLLRFAISDLLERKATEAEKKQGLDLADYLLKFDYREFALPHGVPFQSLVKLSVQESKNLSKPEIQPNKKGMLINVTDPANKNLKKPETWEQDITELETFFKGIQLPTEPIRLNQCSTITDVSLFVESHFATVKMNSGKPAFLPYLNRLQELKQYLKVDLNRYEN